ELELPEGEVEVVISSPNTFKVRNLSLRRRGGPPPSLTPAEPPEEAVEEYRVRIGAEGTRQVGLVLNLNDQIWTHKARLDRYGREVAFVDHHVGQLLDAMRAHGLYDESLIIFTAYHGEALGSHGFIGHIHTVYDCMVRVPLIIKPPRSLGMAVGTRRNDPAALVDILPTILARLDLPVPTGVRGRDLLSPGAANVEPAIFLETHTPESTQNLYGLRGERYKIIWAPDEDRWEFYDLTQDPEESSNLYSATGELATRWRDRLQEQIAGLNQSPEPESDDIPLDAKTQEMLKSLGY
ncbi:MAG: sulfatase/phosphatase domain-containing protein, partial [bacterium]